MSKLSNQVRLLWLFSLFFGYMIIRSFFFDNDPNAALAWTLFLIIYIISLIIMMIVIRTYEKRAEI